MNTHEAAALRLPSLKSHSREFSAIKRSKAFVPATTR